MMKRFLLAALAALGLVTASNAMEHKTPTSASSSSSSSNSTNTLTKDMPKGHIPLFSTISLKDGSPTPKKFMGSLDPEDDLAFRMVSDNLQNSSVPKAFIREAFTHDGIKKHSEISERFDRSYEKKSWEDYRKIFVKESNIKSGTEFYIENKELINNVAAEYRVDPFIVITIAGIESNYGVHHSQFSVFNSLYTQIHEMPRRSKWAAKELAEFLEYCFIDQRNPQEIGGSYAGAFGFGQFIPSSFNRYSVDFNEDGIKEPYGWPDVLGSIANYLRRNGYNANSSNYERDGDIWDSIYAYNPADNYVMAVLELSKEIRKRIEKSNN